MGVRPGTPRPPGSGRKRGSLDREQRKVLTDKMAGDIMRVYQRLGGVAWLLKFAEENPAEFLRQGLSRLFPAPQKPEGDPDIQLNQQFNLEGNPNEIARRVAFVLAAGLQDQQADVVEARQPYARLDPDPSPQELLRNPAPDPQRDEWARQASLSPEEKLNAESLDDRCSRVASAATRPEWMDTPIKCGRPFVGHPRRKDLL